MNRLSLCCLFVAASALTASAQSPTVVTSSSTALGQGSKSDSRVAAYGSVQVVNNVQAVNGANATGTTEAVGVGGGEVRVLHNVAAVGGTALGEVRLGAYGPGARVGAENHVFAEMGGAHGQMLGDVYGPADVGILSRTEGRTGGTARGVTRIVVPMVPSTTSSPAPIGSPAPMPVFRFENASRAAFGGQSLSTVEYGLPIVRP